MSEQQRLLVTATALREETVRSSIYKIGDFLETLRFHYGLGVSANQFVILRVNSCAFVDRLLCSRQHRSTNQHEPTRNPNGTTLSVKPLVFLLAPLLMTSCSRAPSFDILGSYFPAWLICLTLAVVFTVIVRWLLLRLQIGIVFPILVYPSLTALFAFSMWLVFYG